MRNVITGLILISVANHRRFSPAAVDAFSSAQQSSSCLLKHQRHTKVPLPLSSLCGKRRIHRHYYRCHQGRPQTVLLSDNDDNNANNSNEKNTDNGLNNNNNMDGPAASLPPPANILATNTTILTTTAETTTSTPTNTNTNTTTVELSVSTLPSYKKLLLFTSTTILIWISEPLLSLVDTTVVGLTQTNAVVQVAAMGPATTLIDSLQYLTYFLAMATTSQVAKFLALKDYRKLQETTSQILGVAACLGLVISATLFAFGLPLLKTMIGSSSSSPELVGLAASYCWIRASVAPLAVMGMVAESSCLANVDTTTPAIAVFTASVVNIIGDLALAFWGIRGAAIATAVATGTSTTIMLRKVRKRKAMWREKELRQLQNRQIDSVHVNGSVGLTSVSPEGVPRVNGKTNKPNTSNNNNGKKTSSNNNDNDEVPFLSLPDRESFMDLVKISGPMFFVMLGKIVCYGAMSIRATDFGVVNLAAHSIMMRVFFFFTCFGDSLSQATQSFLPQVLYPKPVQKDIRKMLKRFFIFSTFVGLFIAQSSGWILSNFGNFLTNDKAVIGAISNDSKYVTLSLLAHPFIMLTEGFMIATRDFKNLIVSYTVTMALHFTLLLLACSSFRDIWRVLFLFQSVRLTCFGTRVIQQVAKRGREATATTTATTATTTQ